jgi:DNA-binding CsgD family transcriptional regulator/PAS domain-containing protein
VSAVVGPRARIDSTELLYDAALRPRLWQRFISGLSDECGGAAVSLLVSVGIGGDTCRSHQHGLDADFARYWWLGAAPAYVDSPEEPGSRSKRFRFAREFRIGTDPGAISFYLHEMKPRLLAPDAPIVADFSRGTERAGLAIFQRSGHRPLGMDDLRRCEALASHIGRALEIHRRVQMESGHRRSIAEVLDCTPHGVLLLDADGECIYSNAAARRVIALEDGMRFRQRRLTLDDPRAQRTLSRAVARAEVVDDGADADPLSVPRPSGRCAFEVAVNAVHESCGYPGAARTALFLSDPDAMADPELLRSQYGLTMAEAALASLLAAGHSLHECAKRRSIGIGTARGYLKSLYRKTRTHSQRELVGLVLTGLGPLARQPEKPLAQLRP